MGSTEEVIIPEAGDDLQWDELRQRFEGLENRRETFKRLSALFKDDLPPPPQPPAVLADQPSADAAAQVTAQSGEQSDSMGAIARTITLEQDRKLPRFSGEKLSHGEVTFKKWNRAVSQLLEEKNVSNDAKKRAVLRSLNGKADDLAHMHRHKTVTEIVKVLAAQYDKLEDGDDMLAEFYKQVHDEKQRASDFLTELYIELGEVVDHGGLEMHFMDKTLLKQFNRGTHDEDMLSKLRLEEKTDNPPTFPDLLSSIRKEESKRTERRLRHRKQARVHAAVVREESSSPDRDQPQPQPPREDPEVVQLRKRVAELEARAEQMETPEPPPEPQCEVAQLQHRLAAVEKRLANGKQQNFIFCYRCGRDDGHVATDCTNPPNKPLVEQRAAERRKRRFPKN